MENEPPHPGRVDELTPSHKLLFAGGLFQVRPFWLGFVMAVLGLTPSQAAFLACARALPFQRELWTCLGSVTETTVALALSPGCGRFRLLLSLPLICFGGFWEGKNKFKHPELVGIWNSLRLFYDPGGTCCLPRTQRAGSCLSLAAPSPGPARGFPVRLHLPADTICSRSVTVHKCKNVTP